MATTQKQFVLMSGLPRTGSTLLTALLMQNPKIYGEGASALCQLMWDVHMSLSNNSSIQANGRTQAEAQVLTSLPDLYYKDIKEPIIVDKSRTWIHPLNYQLWLDNVDKNQKVIVLVRPVQDVLKSMAALRLKNNWVGDPFEDLLVPHTEPICRAAEAIACSRFIPSENFLYIDYRDLTEQTLEVLNLIYDFFGWEYFEHDIYNIQQQNHEDDSVHGLIGMHDVRSEISVRSIDIELPKHVEEICESLNALVYGTKMDGNWSFLNYNQTV